MVFLYPFYREEGINIATIKTSLQLYDKMSAPLTHITRSLDIVITSMEKMQATSSKAIDTSAIARARAELTQANNSFRQVETQINNAGNRQLQFNQEIRNGTSAADGLAGKVKGIVAAYAGFQGLKKVLSLSDTLTTTKARLGIMNDGLQSTEDLQKLIFMSSERSRGSYQKTADAISKMGLMAGDAFGSNAELVAFMEQINKQFTIAGTSAEGIDAAMLQLTQAMGSGVLRGEELNSVFEQAPTIIQSIADYLGIPIGKVRELAQEGKISASVVKNAMFKAADDTNKKFESMPKTFAQVWSSILNRLQLAFAPVLQKFSELANNPQFQAFIDAIVNALAQLAYYALIVFEIISSIYAFFASNWSTIGPIVWTVVGAFIAYKTAAFLAHAAMVVFNAIQGIAAGIQMAYAAATGVATGAQWGLNTAMYACPLTWIILLIIGIILAVYAVVAAFNKFAGTSVSATGIIAGAIMFALYSIYNIFGAVWNFIIDLVVIVWNLIADFANFFRNVFDDPVAAIAHLFVNLANFVLGLLKSIASAIDFLFGSNLAGTIQGWMDGLDSKVDEMFGKEVEYVAKMNGDDFKLNRADPFEGWDKGYNWGANLEESIMGFNPDDLFGGMGDMSKKLDSFAGSNVPADIGDTANNTKGIKDSLDITSEDLKYLRDLAEQEVINRFTTAELKIDFTANNNVSSDTDIDGIVSALTTKVQEALVSTAEGVH